MQPDFPDYIQVKHSKRARRVALRLDTKARRFDLVIPGWMSLHQAQDFAIDHEDWMQSKLAELPEVTAFSHGAEIPIFGKLVRLEYDIDPLRRQTRIELCDKKLLVKSYLNDPSARIVRFLKAHAQDVMEPLVHEKASIIRKKVRSVTFRDPKSRWGSCSSDGRIMLSWRLLFAPYEAMDYVVAHEVAHLKYMDHSARFWDLCEELSDDYEEGHGWMRECGNELMAFGG